MGGNMNIVYLRLNKNGFTLIELLLTLSIALLLLSFFPPLLKSVIVGYGLKQNVSEDGYMFFNHLAQKIRTAEQVVAAEEAIMIRMNDQDYYYIERRPETNQIRRQLNWAGHVLLLERVNSFRCSVEERLVHCTVLFENGEQLERSMYMLFPSVEAKDEDGL